MNTKSNPNQNAELQSRPEQLGTAEQGAAERPLWCIGYGDREFAKLQGDPVLALVRASTKEEAEAKALALGVNGQGAGLWAWPQPKPSPEVVAKLRVPPPFVLREDLPRLDFAKRDANRQLPTEAVVSLLRTNAPQFFPLAEVVGKWVWVRFAEKQPREVTRQLAELGFHWNSKRQCWQHPCGHLAQGSPADPRAKYGSYHPAEVVA